MRARLVFIGGIAMALTVAVSLPWLAYRESRRQGFEAASELTLNYARDVLHRAEETTRQTEAAFKRLAANRGAPCSPAAQTLMQQIDLSSTYIHSSGRLHTRWWHPVLLHGQS